VFKLLSPAKYMKVPFHAAPKVDAAGSKTNELVVHVIPSGEVAADAPDDILPDSETKNSPSSDAQITCCPAILFVYAMRCVHVIPSGLLAIADVPDPTATHNANVFEYAMPFTCNANGVDLPVHVTPSEEVAILFVPDPPTTQRFCDSDRAIPNTDDPATEFKLKMLIHDTPSFEDIPPEVPVPTAIHLL
jgi:hypothetical protein